MTTTQDAAPGPVSNLLIAPIGSDQLKLSWNPPRDGQITSYEITYQLINRGLCEDVRQSSTQHTRGTLNSQVREQPRTVTSDRPTFVITGLQPHSRYRSGRSVRDPNQISITVSASLPRRRSSVSASPRRRRRIRTCRRRRPTTCEVR